MISRDLLFLFNAFPLIRSRLLWLSVYIVHILFNFTTFNYLTFL